MNELKEYLKRELGITDEQYNDLVLKAKEESTVNKNIVLLKEENLMLMDVSASLFEENLLLRDENLMNMEAVAGLYEEIITFKGGM